MLQMAEEKRVIHGLKFSKDITISHLLFADDSLIFTRASENDCMHLRRIFECYAAASGQLFNYDKSSMFFSGNITNGVITAIKNIFQLNVVSRHEKYLELPSMVGRKKSGFFNNIKLRVSSKIADWQHKYFSCGGKEILIKAVAQAVPAHAMSVFKIPMSICVDIQRAIARFWWSSNMEKKGIHWAKWERLSQAKRRGGLGFRDFASFNQALVAKQSWRIIQFPESLVARVLQARYFKDNQFLTAKLGSKPSFIWRSILWGRQVIHKGIRWRIGNGQQVQIYKGNWIPKPTSFKPVSPPSLPSDTRVAELIKEDNQWNEDMICQHFLREDAEIILRIPIPSTPMADQILWHYDKKGIYTVKSGYQVALRINFPDTPSCSEQPANQCMETVGHALVECKYARKIWKNTRFDAELKNIGGHDILGILHVLVKRVGKSDTEVVVALLWVIWGVRNQRLFKGKRENPGIAAAKAEAVVESFRRIQSSGKMANIGAVNLEDHLVGLGIVIRDANKNFVAAAIKSTKLHCGVTFAEAEAMNWGLKVAYDARLANIIIESDSLEAVDYVNNRKSSRTEIQWLISEIQNRLKEFCSWKTLHTPSLFSSQKKKIAAAGSATYLHPKMNSLSERIVPADDKMDELLERLDRKDGVKAKFFLNMFN
ncbi:putative reverse transcriptase/RNA-dependent DNA polymerase [Citrus sinensis]|nr:putative reverse transcriptase/RNA-dependent DNA polymerase [Citrus sinensis]